MGCEMRITLLAAVLALSTGCATVTSYQKPITDFATATASAETALATLDETVTQEYKKRIKAEIVDGDRLLLKKEGDCNLARSSRCRLKAMNTEGESVTYPPEPVLGNMVILMRGITAYSEGLAAIVNADTAQKVASSVNSALGSIESLAGSVAKISGSTQSSSIAAYKTPTGKAINWIMGQYIARIQLDGLRQATESANPVIKAAVDIFTESASLANVIALNERVQEFDDAWVEYDNMENEPGPQKAAAADKAVAMAAGYDQLLNSGATTVYAAMGDAHDALTKNLNDESKTVVEVVASIEAFSAQAAAVAEIVKEFTNAHNQ